MPRTPELRGLDLAWPALLALHFGAGCSGSDADGAGGNAGATGAGGQGAAAGSAASVSNAVSASATVVGVGVATGAGGSGGGGPFVCDPPAAPGSIFEKTADQFDVVDPVPMCKYRGDVMLIFNGAAL